MKKRVRLTFKEWFNMVIGRKYVLNEGTNEIHNLLHKHVNCHLDLMTNKKYLNEIEMFDLICDNQANGCRFCFNEQDNG